MRVALRNAEDLALGEPYPIEARLTPQPGRQRHDLARRRCVRTSAPALRLVTPLPDERDVLPLKLWLPSALWSQPDSNRRLPAERLEAPSHLSRNWTTA